MEGKNFHIRLNLRSRKSKAALCAGFNSKFKDRIRFMVLSDGRNHSDGTNYIKIFSM